MGRGKLGPRRRQTQPCSPGRARWHSSPLCGSFSTKGNIQQLLQKGKCPVLVGWESITFSWQTIQNSNKIDIVANKEEVKRKEIRNQAEPGNHLTRGGCGKDTDTFSLSFYHLCPEALRSSGAWSSSDLSWAFSAPGRPRSMDMDCDLSSQFVPLRLLFSCPLSPNLFPPSPDIATPRSVSGSLPFYEADPMNAHVGKSPESQSWVIPEWFAELWLRSTRQ